MIQCQNCGQANTGENNFCRFCGTKFVYGQNTPPNNYDFQPPSPYSWKTDEFQTAKPEPRKTEQINFSPNTPPAQFSQSSQSVPPRQFNQPNQYLAPNQNYAPPMTNYGANQFALNNFRCPRCGSQNPPRCERKVSQAGWIVFAVLLVTTGIFFWIGLLMRENVCYCSNCNFQLA